LAIKPVGSDASEEDMMLEMGLRLLQGLHERSDVGFVQDEELDYEGTLVRGELKRGHWKVAQDCVSRTPSRHQTWGELRTKPRTLSPVAQSDVVISITLPNFMTLTSSNTVAWSGKEGSRVKKHLHC
jgi:hypothetical protein